VKIWWIFASISEANERKFSGWLGPWVAIGEKTARSAASQAPLVAAAWGALSVDCKRKRTRTVQGRVHNAQPKHWRAADSLSLSHRQLSRKPLLTCYGHWGGNQWRVVGGGRCV